jgi:hypothetical protein
VVAIFALGKEKKRRSQAVASGTIVLEDRKYIITFIVVFTVIDLIIWIPELILTFYYAFRVSKNNLPFIIVCLEVLEKIFRGMVIHHGIVKKSLKEAVPAIQGHDPTNADDTDPFFSHFRISGISYAHRS